MLNASQIESILKDYLLAPDQICLAEALTQARRQLHAEVVPLVLQQRPGAEGRISFHNQERQALSNVQRDLGLSNADLMAHHLSLDLARNGQWHSAWEAVESHYHDWTRQKWEGMVKAVLVRDAEERHQIDQI